MPISHTKVSELADGSDNTQVQPSDWNDSHNFDVLVHEEIPTGSITSTDGYDGNGTFTLIVLPSPLTSIKLYKNGLRLAQTVDYTITNVGGVGTITYVDGRFPKVGDNHVADYCKA